MDFEEDHADRHPVDDQMVRTHIEGEVIRVLDETEGEAVPAQRIRGGQDVGAQLGRRHLAALQRSELDVGGIGEGVPDDTAVGPMLEPTVVGVVPAQMGIDRFGHGRHVAHAGDIPDPDVQPRHVQAPGGVFAEPAKMMQLLITGRHVANRRLPGFFPRRRSRVPGNDRTGSRIPVMHRPECDRKTSSELRRNYRKAAAIGAPNPGG